MKLVFASVALSTVLALSAAQTISGPTECLDAGGYSLCQNLWGASSGTGSQNSTLVSANSTTVAWSTKWTWARNENSVKSYANVESNTAKSIQLSTVTSAPTSWTWTYASRSNEIRADVAYDIWLGTATSGTPASPQSKYEIMIWLSRLGSIQPVGSRIGTATVAGITWELWSGPNTNWNVFSFVPSSEITNFAVDLNDFFKYLTSSQGVASSQYIHSIQAGTEPFTGSAELVTNSYSVAVSTA